MPVILDVASFSFSDCFVSLIFQSTPVVEVLDRGSLVLFSRDYLHPLSLWTVARSGVQAGTWVPTYTRLMHSDVCVCLTSKLAAEVINSSSCQIASGSTS